VDVYGIARVGSVPVSGLVAGHPLQTFFQTHYALLRRAVLSPWIRTLLIAVTNPWIYTPTGESNPWIYTPNWVVESMDLNTPSLPLRIQGFQHTLITVTNPWICQLELLFCTNRHVGAFCAPSRQPLAAATAAHDMCGHVSRILTRARGRHHCYALVCTFATLAACRPRQAELRPSPRQARWREGRGQRREKRG
jgi:hypothetical protein